MQVAMTGNANPIRNHFRGSRPRRLARREVMIGMLSIKSTPMLTNITAPIIDAGFKIAKIDTDQFHACKNKTLRLKKGPAKK